MCIYCGVRKLRQLFGLQYRDCDRRQCVERRERASASIRIEPDPVVKDRGVVSVNNFDKRGLPSVAGWTSYKLHYDHTPLPPRKDIISELSNPMGFVSRTFNAICSEQGVQCTVTMDPSDYRSKFDFKNFGDRLVRIEYRDEVHYLEPTEEVTLKLAEGEGSNTLPRVIALNNGFDQRVLQEKFY